MALSSIRQTISLKTIADVCRRKGQNPMRSMATNEDKTKDLRKPKTPSGKFDLEEENKAKEHVHPYAEKEPLTPWPNGRNPNTGETFGPKGPEPTRYGDWERKGRVTDF